MIICILLAYNQNLTQHQNDLRNASNNALPFYLLLGCSILGDWFELLTYFLQPLILPSMTQQSQEFNWDMGRRGGGSNLSKKWPFNQIFRLSQYSISFSIVQEIGLANRILYFNLRLKNIGKGRVIKRSGFNPDKYYHKGCCWLGTEEMAWNGQPTQDKWWQSSLMCSLGRLLATSFSFYNDIKYTLHHSAPLKCLHASLLLMSWSR